MNRILDFLDEHSPLLYLLLGATFFIVICILAGSFNSDRYSAAEAQCQSIGGVYGEGECYVQGEKQD